MFLKVVCFLLPTTILAGDIKIEVTGSFTNDTDDLHVEASGEETSVIPDKDMQAFQMTEQNLKDAVERYYGCRPTDVFCKSPTPWGDLYKTYKWKQVTRTLKVKDAVITKKKYQPEIFMEHDINNPDDIDAVYNSMLKQERKNILSIGWSKNSQLGVEASVSFSANLGSVSTGASMSISHTTGFGTNSEKTSETSTETSSSLQINIKPGQQLVAQVRTDWKCIETIVTYEATIKGNVACNYSGKCKGKHFWCFDVYDILTEAGLPLKIEIKQTTTLGYYGKTFVTIYDKNKKKKE